MKKITIAIDGYSSCGKSTLAKQIAHHLGYVFVDTGAMYRAATLFFIRQGVSHKDADQIISHVLNDIHISFRYNADRGASDVILNNENVEKEIRMMEVSESVSHYSTIRELRHMLVYVQQEMGRNKGVVMDGRDIGTVVFPDAELKIFMRADPEIRVQRRFAELQAKAEEVTLDEVRTNLLSRDYEDTHRTESPLTQAPDAVVIDNSNLTEQEQFDLALKLALEKINS